MTIIEVLVQLRDDLKLWVTNNLRTKVDKEEGKGLSSNDFTTEEKEKLASIDPDASVEKEIYIQDNEPADVSNGTVWIDLDAEQRPSSSVIQVPSVTVEDNGKFMMVVDGRWAAVALPNGEGVGF